MIEDELMERLKGQVDDLVWSDECVQRNKEGVGQRVNLQIGFGGKSAKLRDLSDSGLLLKDLERCSLLLLAA